MRNNSDFFAHAIGDCPSYLFPGSFWVMGCPTSGIRATEDFTC